MTRLLFLSAFVMLMLGACTSIPRPCRVDGVDGALQKSTRTVETLTMPELQCLAAHGLRAAQLALAKRYEVGEGVERNLKRAIALYEEAARPAPTRTALYSPPVKPGGRGQIFFISNPDATPGSAEAQFRLGRLLILGSDVPRQRKRGRSLLEQSAKQGYPPAIAALDQLKGSIKDRDARFR